MILHPLAEAFASWRAWRLIGQAHRAMARGDREKAVALLRQARAAVDHLGASLAARGAL